MPAPKKEWKKRERSKPCFDWAIEHGYTKLQAHILSGRYSDVSLMESVLTASIMNLDKPDTLPDISKAAKRIAKAVKDKEIIGLETDHDCDGVTSHAIIYEALVEIIGHPKDKLRSYIGHRLLEGYGLSDSVANRIIQDSPCPTLIITADNGSSDEARIAKLKVHEIDTIVTDHHEIPVEGIPNSAVAVVTPAREDSDYPDPLIAGCMVACLTMAAVRQELIDQGFFCTTPPSMSRVFDYVALGTVADCVSMSRSKNNRLIVEYGLKLINEGRRPCWRAMKPYLGEPGYKATATDLGFKIGPMINARGRLDEAMLGVLFLLEKDDKQAIAMAKILDQENKERKKIEAELQIAAFAASDVLVDQGYQSLVVFLENGHSGVHGIVASRVTEAYGRPSIMISPKYGDPSIVSASGRGVPDFHVREALQAVANQNPGLLVKFGGHKGAAGMSFNAVDIDRFRASFEQETLNQINASSIYIGPVAFTDGMLPPSFINMNTIDEYSRLEPFGREMDAPVFESRFQIVPLFLSDYETTNNFRMGEKKNNVKFKLQAGNQQFTAVMFNIDPDLTDEQLGITVGVERNFLFTLNKNHYKGKTTLQLQIKDIRK